MRFSRRDIVAIWHIIDALGSPLCRLDADRTAHASYRPFQKRIGVDVLCLSCWRALTPLPHDGDESLQMAIKALNDNKA